MKQTRLLAAGLLFLAIAFGIGTYLVLGAEQDNYGMSQTQIARNFYNPTYGAMQGIILAQVATTPNDNYGDSLTQIFRKFYDPTYGGVQLVLSTSTGKQVPFTNFTSLTDGDAMYYSTSGTEWLNTQGQITISGIGTSPVIQLENPTNEDTDGGRESAITAKGFQSGAEESTLGSITFQHKDATDDEEGEIIFAANDGNDSDSPTSLFTMYNDPLGAGLESLTNTFAIKANGTYIMSGSASGYMAFYRSFQIQQNPPQIQFYNTFQSDADGERKSQLDYRGRLSAGAGGTAHNLVRLQGSHSGTGSDQNGQFEILINDGNDGDTPSVTGLKIDYDGSVTLADYTRSITIGASAAVLGPTAPTLQVVGTYAGYMFDADNEVAYPLFEVPDDWDGASNMTFKAYWSNEAGDAVANTETVKFDISYRCTAEGEDIDAGTAATGTVTYTQSGAGTDGELFESEITLAYDDSNQPLVVDSVCGFQFDRDVTGDSYSGGAIVLQWEIDYTSNSIPKHD